MEKRGILRQHIQRSNILTLLQEGKINSKLCRNTVKYIVNPKIFRTTKKSLTSTLKTLDCETPVNSEQLASPPSTPTVSTPNAVNKKAQEFSFADLAHPSPLSDPVTVTPKN